MITEQDLYEAIAECQGAKAPNANTCIKLAAYYTILNNMKEPNVPMYSMSKANEPSNTVNIPGDTEFAKTVNGMDYEKFIPVVTELVEALQVVNPRLYNSFMGKLAEELY